MYCAHCERIAQQENNSKRRSRIPAATLDKPRYRHVGGKQCGCRNRSVTALKLEEEFSRLIKLFSLKEDLLSRMLDLALQVEVTHLNHEDIEREKANEIAKLKRRLAANKELYGMGDIDRDTYVQTRDEIQRLLAHWEAKTTEAEKKALELANCLSAFNELTELWDHASGEQRIRLARGIFEYIVFDLDQQRIVDFRLHPWADQYLILRGELYEQERGEKEQKEGAKAPKFSRIVETCAPYGIRTRV